MTAETVATMAAAALGLWCAAIGGATLVRASFGLVQDHTSPLMVRWWLSALLLAAVTVAVGAGLAWWAADLVGVLP